MDAFIIDELIGLLGLPDTDYWADIGSVDARAIIDKESHALLPLLLAEWPTYSANVQENLAYILGDGESQAEREILIGMSKSDNFDVACRAHESLRLIESNVCFREA